MTSKVLVCDDEELMRDLVTESLTRMGMECLTVKNAIEALKRVDEFDPDLIVSDFKMPGMTGLEFLIEVRKKRPTQPFIIMTAYGTIDTAVEAMQEGAADFVEKPFQPEFLEARAIRALENGKLKAENKMLRKKLAEKHSFVGGHSEGFKELEDVLVQTADSKATILVLGESGVGKEVLARNVHARSERASASFVKINCAALPENLIESELFGYEKGAFTGAMKTKKGKFEQAHKGTLLLDEIGELPMLAQSKLLRVLQEKEVVRLGGDDEIGVDVRIICTTNRDLEVEVAEGRFREDLYYRINVIPVRIPSLRERVEDIENLANYFIEKHNAENGYSVEGLNDDALKLIKAYEWPGNIRQLENSIERAMVFTKTGLIEPERFDMGISEKVEEATKAGGSSSIEAGMTVAEMEQILIIKTLEKCENNKSKAAEMLNVSIRTLRNKLHEYGAFVYEREKKDEDGEK